MSLGVGSSGQAAGAVQSILLWCLPLLVVFTVIGCDYSGDEGFSCNGEEGAKQFNGHWVAVASSTGDQSVSIDEGWKVQGGRPQSQWWGWAEQAIAAGFDLLGATEGVDIPVSGAVAGKVVKTIADYFDPEIAGNNERRSYTVKFAGAGTVWQWNFQNGGECKKTVLQTKDTVLTPQTDSSYPPCCLPSMFAETNPHGLCTPDTPNICDGITTPTPRSGMCLKSSPTNPCGDCQVESTCGSSGASCDGSSCCQASPDTACTVTTGTTTGSTTTSQATVTTTTTATTLTTTTSQGPASLGTCKKDSSSNPCGPCDTESECGNSDQTDSTVFCLADKDPRCGSVALNCFHADWGQPCSCAKDQVACESSLSQQGNPGVWRPSGCNDTKPSKPSNSSCPDGEPDNCFHGTWAVKCSCAKDQAACEASQGGEWKPAGCQEQQLSCPAGQPDNCFHADWAVKCSCAKDQAACEASQGGEWKPAGCQEQQLSCPAGQPDNCFHGDWAVKCSCAKDQAACEASQGGEWKPAGCQEQQLILV